MNKDYNTRRQELAEEMAMARWKDSWDAAPSWRKGRMDDMLPIADISLRHTATELRKFGMNECTCPACRQNRENYLLTTGLVPDKNERI